MTILNILNMKDSQLILDKLLVAHREALALRAATGKTMVAMPHSFSKFE